ncbi:MAG: EexN family lipoprotein [Nitrospira sp.]|nr:EexN family lipoprotein [Nitrospira sp.]
MNRQRCSQRTMSIELTCAVLLSGMIALTGCTKEALEPVNTVEWYKAHDAEREIMLQKCQSNPGQLAETPNCINAKEAASRLFLGS